MAQLLVVIIGHNASGKTTLAKRLESDLGISRISGDDFRHFLKQHVLYLHDWDTSQPTDLGKSLRPLTTSYRLQLIQVLLEAQQSVVIDGSGFTHAEREPLIEIVRKAPEAKVVAIFVDIQENELLNRLEARGGNWVNTYHTIRKNTFEPPLAGEVDKLLVYNQHNYDEIKQKLQELLV